MSASLVLCAVARCPKIAKGCLFTGQEQACSRITSLVVQLVGCRHHAEIGLIHRKMVVDYPIVVTSIGDTLFQTRPDQE